jgi:hypothetical protein
MMAGADMQTISTHQRVLLRAIVLVALLDVPRDVGFSRPESTHRSLSAAGEGLELTI